MTNVKKLFLIDAFAIIYRSYFAFSKNPRINSKGLETSAILGFVNTLIEVLKKQNPTHIAVVFDTPVATIRHVEYSEYKANREAMPEGIALALPYIDQILDAFNISKLFVDGYEADDVIGTLAKKAEKAGFTTYMMTPDKDFAQLVSDNILLYRPGNKWKPTEVWGVDEVLKKFEIQRVEQVIDFLGMMGDSVDNIPGLPGVGEKTAKKFLAEYGTMENLLANTERIKGKLKDKIIANKEQGILSKKLARILLDVPINLNEAELQVKKFNSEKVTALFEELEFRTLATRLLGVNFLKTNTPKQSSGASQQSGQMNLFSVAEEVLSIEKPIKINTNYQLINSREKQVELLENLMRQNSVSFNIQTQIVSEELSNVIGLSFCYRNNNPSYIPVPKGQEREIFNLFKPFFENSSIEKIGHNIKSSYKSLIKYNIKLEGICFDTMLAHYLLEPEQRHELEILANNYLNYKSINRDKVMIKKNNQLPIEIVSENTNLVFQLKELFSKELKKHNLTKLFQEIEIPLIAVLAEMEFEGIRIDTSSLNEFSQELETNISKLNDTVQEKSGISFNLSSPKQLGEVLFEHLQLIDKPKKTKTGQYSTSEETLQKLRGKHEIIDDILAFRKLQKLKSTYVDALPELASKDNQRIHTTYQQAVTSTGRLSSTNPNLQNIPIRSEKGREVRKTFIPRDHNHILLAADYSQIELRVMAHLSQDKALLSAFQNGEDIHAATASKVYQIELDKVNREQRSNAKMVNFGIIYGISAFGLAQRLGIKRLEAKEIIENYFKEYPKVKDYMDLCIEETREKGYIETIMGRKRILKDINSRNTVVRRYAERNAINAPIQGSAADIIKIAMININKSLKNGIFQSKMLLQVHDELVFDIEKSEVEKVSQLIKEKMENAIQLSVPLKIDIGTGLNWLEAH